MEWVYIVLLAYLLQAVVFIFDSLLVNKHIKSAAAYAFFISLLGLAAFLLAPFGFSLISPRIFTLSLVAGGAFTFGTLFLYRALQKHETSRVIPVVGGTAPLFSFLLASILLPEQLSSREFFAFLALVAGTVLITYPFYKEHAHHMKPRIIAEMLLSGLLFALWATFSKRVFLETNFANGIIWIRIGAAIAGLLFLFSPALRKEIFKKRTEKLRLGGAIIANKTLGAGVGLLILYAIARGNPALVQALQGVQFVFLFGLVAALSHYFPRVFREDLRPGLVAQKLGSSIIIAFGVALLLT